MNVTLCSLPSAPCYVGIMYPTVNPKKCNGCGNCADICPSEVYEMEGDQSNAIRPEDCIECWACVSQCPAEAIDLQED